MNRLLALTSIALAFTVVPLFAQDAPPPPQTAETPSPVPSTESWLTGSIDVGYRWRTDVGGNFDTYRSIVNLKIGRAHV